MAHYRAAEALLGEVSVGLAVAALRAVHIEEGLAASKRALAIGERLGDQGLWAHAALLHGWHLWASGRVGEGMALPDRASEAAERAGDLFVANLCGTWGSQTASMLGDPKEGQRRALRALSRPGIAQAAALIIQYATER
ncbi:MAG: hypothetical protein ACR2PL_22595 [Dehalococcoidia bacterium]